MNNYNSLINKNYKSKYYLYKKKYLQLKQKLGGVVTIEGESKENYFETAIQYLDNLVLRPDPRLVDHKFIYVNMGGVGKGGIVPDINNETFILGTDGLCGCTAIAINLKINSKNIVWLTHVASDINYNDANILVDEILKELKYYSKVEDLDWSYFTLNNWDSQINLIEANPNRTFGSGEAFDKNKKRIPSGLLIKQIIESKGIESKESPYASRESGKGFHFIINNKIVDMKYEYPIKFPTFE
jgi:hypothetical protein